MICKNQKVLIWPVMQELTLGFDRLKTTPDRFALAAGCTTTLNRHLTLFLKNLLCLNIYLVLRLRKWIRFVYERCSEDFLKQFRYFFVRFVVNQFFDHQLSNAFRAEFIKSILLLISFTSHRRLVSSAFKISLKVLKHMTCICFVI